MTSRSLRLVVVLAGIFGASAALAADDPIKDRKDLMKGNGKAVKGVVAMLKGEAPYDGGAVAKAMKDINGSLTTFVTLFPKGSETGGETAAKPDIWDNKVEFGLDRERSSGGDRQGCCNCAGRAGRFQGGVR